jgi:DMSO reductase family type II enzyme heme b subunit
MAILRSRFFQGILVLLASFVLFRFGIRPPVPRSVLTLYMAIVLVAVLVYVSSDSDSWRSFIRPIVSTIVDDTRRPLRLTLVILLPLLAAYYAFPRAASTIEAPPELRAVHPAPPTSISFRGKTIDVQGLDNPLRKDSANFQKHVREGGEVYSKNCVYCHGDNLDGKGHFAHGFNPTPADFTDPGTIAMLQESYLFWRIAKGGPGLPKESNPWNSAMPAWEDRLSEEEIWKVILYLYEAAGVQPRRWEAGVQQHLHASRPAPQPRTPHPALRAPDVPPRPSPLALFSIAWAQQADANLGKQVYEKRCAFCHGIEGKGDGPAAPFLDPRPRDFTRGLYKIRSTPSGTLPTDDDLFRIVTEGMPGTSMPAWRTLPEHERRAVIQYVKGFSDRFKTEGAGTPIQVGGEIGSSKESLDKGHRLYQDLECFSCHGKEGRADGPSVPTLKDDWGDRTRPADLTKRWNFRGGGSVKAIYTRFNTGIAGTPMPSYADSIDAEQSWHLSNYVASLGPEGPGYGTVITTRLALRDLPATPGDQSWEKIPPTNFPLVGQVIVDPRNFTPSIDMVTVKAVYNEKGIAFLLSWNDPTRSVPAAGDRALPDALALQFPAGRLEGGERPYFLMGDSRQPVYLIRWRSDAEGMEELTAAGPGRVQAQPGGAAARTNGTVVYSDGQYRLLVTRPLTSDASGVPGFDRGRFIPIAFQAWDGGNGESGTKMSVSAWYYLFLQEPTSTKSYAYPPLAAMVTVAVELLIIKGVRRRYGGREG